MLRFMRKFSGWPGAFLFVVFYFTMIFGAVLIGGDTGAFLYVTFQFVIMPIYSLFFILLTFLNIFTTPSTFSKKISHLLSSVVGFIYLFFFFQPIAMELFKIDFNSAYSFFHVVIFLFSIILLSL